MEEFVASIGDDARLFPADVRGSMAHVRALRKGGLITSREKTSLLRGLRQVLREFQEGKLDLKVEDEDVHMNVERRLREILGPVAAKIHTGRSRNDQVALDLRIWAREQMDLLRKETGRLQASLRARARRHATTILPGYTHLQRAQPVTFGHVLLSYHEMVARDEERLAEARRRTDVSPLGAAALAGTSLPIDPAVAAAALGFAGVFGNSIDAVSDRDFAVEIVFACSLLLTHLSRIAEDLILWSSEEFRFIDLPDELCTSSSLLPQKKNADMVELVRAKSGRVLGDLVGLLAILKALPSGYNRDLQETKPPLFDAVGAARGSVQALTLAIRGMKVNKDVMLRAAAQGALMATDLAEHLVERGVPFREAHQAVARLMGHCTRKGIAPEDLPLDEMRRFSPAFGDDARERLSPADSVRRRIP